MKSRILIVGILTMFLLCYSFELDASKSIKNKSKKNSCYSKVDSAMKTVIPVEYVDFMMSAKRIDVKCSTPMHSLDDSVCCVLSCHGKQTEIVKYVFVTADFVKEVAVAYGKYCPYVEYVFYHKKTCCTIQVDFGLMQFRLLDKEKRVVGLYAMNDKSIIKLSYFLFPNDEFINFINKQK